MLPAHSLIGLNPYEAIPQIRVICEALDIELGLEPTDDEIQRLFSTLGKGKVYGTNAEELAIGDEIYQNLVVLNAIEEMLIGFGPRSVHSAAGPDDAVYLLGTGATANWMLRRAREAADQSDLRFRWIYLVASNRPMDDRAGQPNPFILEYIEENEGELPVEWQTCVRIWHAVLGRYHDVVVHESDDLEANVVTLAKQCPEITERKLYVPLNAAAVDKAFQIRAALRQIAPEFDSNPDDPQFYFSSDSFTVATSPEEAAKAAVYQRPKTFLSAVPRYVKQLHELKN